MLNFMGNYPYALNSNSSLDSIRSFSQQKSLESLHDDRHSYLPKINNNNNQSVTEREPLNQSPVNNNMIYSSVQLQRDIDFFMNDVVGK